MITRTIVCLILAAPDQRRRVYGVYRAVGTSPQSPCLEIREELDHVTLINDEHMDYRAYAELYATKDAPVWEKL